MEEREQYHPFLTPSQKDQLSQYEHALDLSLTDSDLQFLDDNGYLVVKDVVEDELIDRLVQQTFSRAESLLGFVRSDRSTWKALGRFGIPDLWHVPALYELRQHPRLYSLFAQLLKTPKLCVSIDRVSVKTPCEEDGATNEGIDLHTDLNFWTTNPRFPQYQGGLCLADCPAGGGGFFCVPGFHKPERIERYQRDFEAGKFGRLEVPREGRHFIEFSDVEYAREHVVEVPLKKGEFVIWNGDLPHNGGKNTLKDHWRLHAFVRFMPLSGPCVEEPVIKKTLAYRDMVNKCMKTGERPSFYSTGNAVKGSNQARTREIAVHRAPTLTPLGQKIWGEKPWPGEKDKSSRKKK